ncbi:uncharacterized protein LOC130047813 [Ostrea edulis]|uniref:uncharacterized protein LOC130047813 n=1 Tax=Ostrea edulis TaxID=37623 RepID=UPI0024AEE0E7|nr:uncharacterized protein LOC130047813 [Ostrea edulis]
MPRRSRNFDKADEVSSRGSAPPPLASGDAIQKRKRSWKNNRVWRRENQSQLQQQSSLPVGHKVIANQVQIQQLKSSSPAKVLKDPEPNQPEPPGFLRRYWCVNRVWRRDREWRREEHTPVDPPLEVATSTQSPGACLDPPSDQKKSVSITTTDNEVTVGKKQQGQKAKGDTDSIRRKHDSRPPPVNKDIVSGAEGKSTRKRKRPECPVVPSKRSKSDKVLCEFICFSAFYLEIFIFNSMESMYLCTIQKMY